VTALVASETLVLVLLVLLVAGLLRSHAEILRQLRELRAPDVGADAPMPSPGRRAGGRDGHDVVGVTLERDGVKVGLGGDSPPTLLAFLSSGCTVCERFWDDLRTGSAPPELPLAVRFVLVTKDSSHESPSRLRALAPDAIPVVMSSAAWRDYRVPAAPYFVYLEGGRVHGEGSATGWRQIASLLRDAIQDAGYGRSGDRRTSEVDDVFTAAGILPGHPSLYPRGGPREAERE
jgi:hypothetical protein